MRFKVVNHVLVLHQLDLQMLIGLVVVGQQVVDAFEECGHCTAIVFFLEKELLLGEDLD